MHLAVRVDPVAHGFDRIALGKPLEDDLLRCHTHTIDATALYVKHFLWAKGRPNRRAGDAGLVPVGGNPRVAEPMFRLKLFRIRMFTAGNVSGFLSSLARGGL